MDYYKIIKFTRKHHGMRYRKGLNTDKLDFNPNGSCEPGGLYFSREDILDFLRFGCFVCKVTLPEGEVTYQDERGWQGPVKWKAHRIILGPFQLLTPKRIQKLIDEGAHVDLYGRPLYKAMLNHDFKLVKLLIENGAEVSNIHISEVRYMTPPILRLLLDTVKKMPEGEERTRRVQAFMGELVMSFKKDKIKVARCILESGLFTAKDYFTDWNTPTLRSNRMKKLILKHWGGSDSPYKPSTLCVKSRTFSQAFWGWFATDVKYL